jgi:hypothetical protein
MAGLLQRTPPDYNAWLTVLEKHIHLQEDEKVWSTLLFDLHLLGNAQRERSILLIRTILEKYPHILNTQECVFFVSRTIRWLPDDLHNHILSSWLASDWSHANQAFGEIIAIGHILLPSNEKFTATCNQFLQDKKITEENLDVWLGMVYTASELWDNHIYRDKSHLIINSLISIADKDISHALMDTFRRTSTLPLDHYTNQLLNALIENPLLLEQPPFFLIDRLKNGLRDGLSPRLVLNVINALVGLNLSKISDIRTHWAADADKLIDLSLTLQRYPDVRSDATSLFERLLEGGAYSINDTLRELDCRMK